MSRLEQIRQEKNDVAAALRETNSELLTLIQSRKALSEKLRRLDRAETEAFEAEVGVTRQKPAAGKGSKARKKAETLLAGMPASELKALLEEKGLL